MLGKIVALPTQWTVEDREAGGLHEVHGNAKSRTQLSD